MKVLMIGNDPSVKGGITSVINQLREYDWKKRKISLRFIPTYIDSNPVKKILFFLRAYVHIAHMLNNNRPDVVHIHMSYKGSFMRKYMIHALCRKKGIPDIIHLHGSEFEKWYDETNDSIKRKIRKLLRESAAFIVLGEKWNNVIKKIEPQTNTIVVNNTVHIPDECAYWQRPLQVLYLGVLIKRKGVSDLLSAIHILDSKEQLEDIKFIIAGSGEEEDRLKSKCDELKLQKAITFAGWVDGEKKTELMKKSQILVLPSYNEGLPMSILEAISYGMPVISTDVGDVSAAVHDGINGYLYKAGDIEALSNLLISIINNEKLYNQMSINSKSIAEKLFSDVTYYELIERLYRNVSANRGQ